MAEETDRAAAALRRFRPYPKYKDSGVEWLGEIPTHWQSLALGRVTISRCDGPFGSGLKSEHYSESGIRVVRLQNIGWAEFADLDAAYLDEAYARQLGDHNVKREDVLIAGLGDDGHPVGRACVAPVEIEPAMVKADCFRFRLDRQRALPRYAAFQLSATAAAVAGRYATGATRARMNLATSASRKITLPPLKEQEAIVAFLDRETAKIDALVARKERLIELLQEKRTALITRAVTRGLDPNVPMKDSGVEWLGEIPEHWEVRRLRVTVVACQNGVWGDEADGVQDVICVRVADFDRVRFRVSLDEPTMRSVDPRTLQTRRLGNENLLLEKSGGGDRQPVGATVMYDHSEPAVCSNFVARMPVADGHRPRYLTYLHATLYAARVNVRSIKQSTGIQNLDSESYLNEAVGLPRDSEQEAIAAFLDRETTRIDVLISKVQKAIDHLKEFRTAVISGAVTGKIDVREAAPR